MNYFVCGCCVVIMWLIGRYCYIQLLIYYDINEFIHKDFYDDQITAILKNIDSLKYGLMDSFSISRYKTVFRLLVEDDFETTIGFPESGFNVIFVMAYFYKIHPIVKKLIIVFYMTKYKCCDRQSVNKFFKSSLRKYMGFFLEQEITNECRNLTTFILDELLVLSEATNLSRKYLIHYYYKHRFDYRFITKEYSETLSVFNLMDFKNKSIVNICAGNAIGIHLLDVKMTCIDWQQYNGMKLLVLMDVCNFIQCNIMDNRFETLVSPFNLWIAIHACRELAIRIIEIFRKCASEHSELYIVPCCNLSKKFYKANLDDFIYDRIYGCYYPLKSGLREYCFPAMHIELLCSLCLNYKFKIKTLRDMKSEKNKIIIVYNN